jgi:putative thiamine transport system ATP-binding protein
MTELDKSKGLCFDALEISHDNGLHVALDTHVMPGEILSVMGPSGVGKSTLLSAIIGTLAKGFRLNGRIVLNGQDITHLPQQARRVGVLFQDPLLFPHMTVGANLAFGLAPGGSRSLRRAKIEEALEQVGLAGYYARDPQTLSGGQRARVALMRMLLSNPSALLLDEPFSGLDSDLRQQVRSMVFERAIQQGLPVLMVTHDAEDAQAAGGEIHRLGRS